MVTLAMATITVEDWANWSTPGHAPLQAVDIGSLIVAPTDDGAFEAPTEVSWNQFLNNSNGRLYAWNGSGIIASRSDTVLWKYTNNELEAEALTTVVPGAAMLEIAVGDGALWATTATNEFYKWSMDGLTILRHYNNTAASSTIPENPHYFAFDGTTIYCTAQDGIWIADTSDEFDAGGGDWRLPFTQISAVSGNWRGIAVGSSAVYLAHTGNSELYSMPIGGGSLTLEHSWTSDPVNSPNFDPNGLSWINGRLYIADFTEYIIWATPAPPPPPKYTPCVLGQPETRIVLLDKCGERVVQDITESVSFSKWGRELDDDSELEVSLHMRGDSFGRACCDALENTRTWRNDLAVIRGGDIVWGPGPIVTISIQREIAHLVARDITAWLDVRLIHNDYTFDDVDLMTIARTCIVDGLTLGDAALLPEDVRDACILKYAQFSETGKTASMEIIANQRTAGEVLRELAFQGLDFTVINRSLIVGADFAFGPIGPLHDEDFMIDLEVAEHGLAAATKWYVSGTDNQGIAGGPDDFYGLIERGIETATASTPVSDLSRQARERLAASSPPPLTINVPSEAHLSYKAAICIEQLVPGTLVDISVRDLCRAVNVRQRLTAIQVINDDKGERIGVTIAPTGPLGLVQITGGEA